MDVLKKREAAHQLLKSKGILRSNYAPPAVRLLWRLGFDVPPPHFAGFGVTALVTGSYFGVAWGLLMWLLFWSHKPFSVVVGLVSASGAGILFGIFMASYYAYGRRKYGIPMWRDFNSSSNGT